MLLSSGSFSVSPFGYMCVGDQLWGGGIDHYSVLFGTSASQAEEDKGNKGAMRPLLPVLGDPLVSGKRITSIASEKATPHPPPCL